MLWHPIVAGGLFLTTIAVTLIVTVPGYSRLLRAIESLHPDLYDALGRPTMVNRSPRKSFQLQKFIYRGSRAPGIAPEVAHRCRFLGTILPFMLVALLAEAAWFSVLVFIGK